MEIQPKPFGVMIVSLHWMRVAHHLPRDFFAFRIGFVAVHVDNCYAHNLKPVVVIKSALGRKKIGILKNIMNFFK